VSCARPPAEPTQRTPAAMGRFTPAGLQRRGRATRLAVPAGADLTAEVKAVAVNGVIGGVSETFSSAGSDPTWFSAVVPDSLMRPGDNHLQLFVLEAAGSRQRLRPLTLTG